MRPLFLLMTVAVLLFSAGGFFVAFHFASALIRADMQRIVRQEQARLQRFEFSASEWQQVRRNKREFCLNGLMYDIAQLEVVGARIKVWAVCDERESQLQQQLYARFGSDSSGTPPSTLWLLSLLFQHGILPSIENTLTAFTLTGQVNYASNFPYLFAPLNLPFVPPESA
ncbi:MAG: hypothetical protein NZL95_08630 [Chitinophagales bacterium]|nr:hypothetical protein [Chitinophagales bacterium]MDW8428602.1 hypothetical protein [Chitinophagales bacterium]